MSDTGLKAISGIHNSVMGPALGGTRMFNYSNEWEALNDVLRLSRGMTFKSAITGLNIGGGKAVIIGDAKNQSVKSIWFGNEMQTYYKMFLEGRRKGHPVCRNCGQLTHGMPDNIDAYSNELLKKIK